MSIEAIEYTVRSTNLQADADFYCGFLGFEFEIDLIMGTGERKIALRSKAWPAFKIRFALNPGLYRSDPGMDLPALCLRMDDLQALRARLETAGVAMFGVSDHPYGSWVKVRDPSGNAITLSQHYHSET